MSGKSVGRNIHFRHYFHPAGHGTFFSGHIRRDGADHDQFVWVYDCGSRRWRYLERLVDQFAKRVAGKNFIDMLCLSHFDSDHVSGVETLLDKVKVGVLVLPYLSVEARLALACTLSGSEPSAHRLAAMIVDPTRYLSERGLRERVERVILVRGGPSRQDEGDDFYEVSAPLEPSGDGGGDRCDLRIDTHPLGAEEAGHQDETWIEVATHDRQWRLGGLYELTFYNSALPYGQAPKSGATLREIAEEVAQVITKFDLCSSSAPAKDWVKELKKLYIHHFGGSSPQKNDISLCALGRPLVAGSARTCKKFAGYFSKPEFEVSLGHESKRAILMTGDISLDSTELDSLRQHVGPRRWNSIAVMQVPHHGSEHSWEPGLSAQCVQQHSVICAAPSASHPHPDVENDLAGRNPVCASYIGAVTFDYHIALGR